MRDLREFLRIFNSDPYIYKFSVEHNFLSDVVDDTERARKMKQEEKDRR